MKTNLRKLVAAVVVGGLIPTASFAAFSIFLKMDNVAGDVQTKGYEKTMEVLAFSWGAERVTPNGAGMMVKPCAHVTELALTKFTDSATPALITNLMSGMTIPKARLSLVKAGEIQQEFITLDLTGVTVTGVQQGSSSGEDRPVENLSLKFTGATFSYKGQDAKGGSTPAVSSTFKAGAC